MLILVYPIPKLYAVLSNWQRYFLFCCFFLRVETILVSTMKYIQISKILQKQIKRRTEFNRDERSRFEVILSDCLLSGSQVDMKDFLVESLAAFPSDDLDVAPQLGQVVQ